MSKIRIPFLPEFKDRMLAGEKTCTARNKKYGEPGDTFEKFGATFMLTNVHTLPLEGVATQLFKQEGFKNDIEFMDCWVRLHPRKGWVPEQTVFVHHWEPRS